MESLDPITLAIIAVVVAIVLSALLLLLFATREEKYEDVLAAQRSEQEAYMARTASTKPVKQRKKLGKGKKKYSDDGEGQEEVSSLQVEETIESNVEISRSNNLDAVLDVEFLPDRPEEKIPVPEEKPSSGITKDRQGKKKSKKVVVKEDTSSVTERRVILDKPREVEEMVSQVVDSTVDSEPDKPEDFETEQPKTLNTSEAAAPAKKSKSKPKTAKDRDPIQGEVSVKRLMEMVTVSNLNSTEIQSLIDVLLNKQGENSQWKKSSSKGDTLELLKKQLQEKETQISEERRQSQNAANKLRELRDELQQEKQKNKSQQANATSKITAQTKEIQALQTRMQASHDSHTLEVQTLQTQLHQLQDVMSSSSVGNIQRLQEENSQLKNASMRAAQLTADKESLTTELTKLQQTCRHVKGELGTKIDQLSQSEEKVRQLTIHQNSVKEAENVLSKRLAEVNEELQKSQARNTLLQKDLNSTAQGLKAEEAKTSELNKRLSELSAADSSQADALHSLTAKLQEATARVSELQKIVADVEDQLKKSQEVKMQKDKEIQVLQGELKLARESVQTSVSNHVSSAAPAENGKEPNVSAKIQEDALKVKEDVIAELNSNVLKKDEEIASLKSLLDEQKNKNNAANDAVANGQSDVVKEKDDAITKLTEELEEKKEECSKLENVIQQQKDKNNELREKNWKAMDALSNMEKSVNSKIKSAVESVKGENKTIMLEEQNETKAVLCRVHPNVMVDSTLPYKKWLGEFEKQASKSSGDSEELEELTRKFKEVQAQKDTLVAECAHYKVTLQETESLLKKLEDNVESEMDNWQKIVERTQRELKEANDKISTLEGDLQKTTGSASSQLDTIASLEQHLKDARAAESEAKQRFSELQEQLAKSTVSEDSDKVRNLEKELEVLRAQDRELTDTISKLESTEKDLIKCKQQMETSVKEIAERDNDLKTAKGELAKVQSSEEELKKKVVSLEEALTKANNDLGKSQESLDSLNNSPDKKKKGLKGALNKVMSKKDKEKEDGKLEEAQRMLTEQRAEIDDLKNSKQALEKQHKALEVEYKELKRLSISVESELTKSQQIEKDISEAMSEPQFHGTLKPADDFDASKDAEALRKAMQGSGSDKDAIVAILGARSNKQRQEIAAKYQQKYNRSLTEELKSELGGKFQDAAVALMAVPENYDAVSLHDAMSGLGTDEQVLIEILSSRSYEELQVIKSAYTKIYTGKDVLKKIKEDTNGEFRTTLMNLIEKNRDSNEKVNEDLAKADARKLLEAGQGKKGADKAVFVEILTSRNYAQLRATFDAYKTLAKSDFMDSINEYLKGDLQNALRAIVRCAQDPALFFAEVLEKALDKGNSKIVTRVLVTRSEVDLADIKTQYQKKTGQPLKDVVAKKMKGDLEKILLQLLGN